MTVTMINTIFSALTFAACIPSSRIHDAPKMTKTWKIKILILYSVILMFFLSMRITVLDTKHIVQEIRKDC